MPRWNTTESKWRKGASATDLALVAGIDEQLTLARMQVRELVKQRNRITHRSMQCYARRIKFPNAERRKQVEGTNNETRS